MVRVYLAAPVRGHNGDSVPDQEKLANVRAGVIIGDTIRKAFPSLEVFVPHEHEEIIDCLWKKGVSSEQILDACCEVVEKRDLVIVYDAKGITKGMAREVDHATKHGIPVFYMDDFEEETWMALAAVILALRERQDESTTG